MTFKVRLLLGAAAPLVFSLPAFAQVSISTATTAPVSTNTANSGSPSDVAITSTGSITLTTAGSTAVTINSNNKLTNAGTIVTNNADNSVGVRILPGVTGGYSATGAINLTEDYVRTDTDSDGDLDGPLASGTGRVGILVDTGGTVTGDIVMGFTTTTTPAASTILVEGNDSYGVSVRSNLNGGYLQNGGITVIGTNAVGVDIRGDVSGNVEIGSETYKTTAGAITSSTGGVAVTGQNAIGVNVSGDVGGEFVIDGAVSATGFAQGSKSNYIDPDLVTSTTVLVNLDADDLLVGGSAVVVSGNLAHGMLVNGPAVGGVDPTDTIKDVVQDYNENRTGGAISVLGSAPALLVQARDGVTGESITLTQVRETVRDTLDDDNDSNIAEPINVFNYNYGLMNRGSIIANGVNTGFSSTAVKIAGSADATHTTTVLGGIFNGGSITSLAFEANATGMQIGSGAITPQLVNTGTIRGDVFTENTDSAFGVRIEAGASVGSVTNSGLLAASVRGWDGNATAFADLSGTVTSFTNTSRIGVAHIDDDATDTITSGLGVDIALDLSHGASGVTLTQTDTIDNARIVGDILFGAGSDQFNLLSGEVTGDVSFGTGSDSLVVNSAKLTGDSTFGGTGANVSLVGGEVAGNLTLGSASGALSFANLSTFNGSITRTSASAMTLSVNNSTVNNFAAGTLNLSSMSLSNNARLGLTVDNARVTGNIPLFNVSGALSIDANTTFTPIFTQFVDQPFTLRVINAGSITNAGTLSSQLAANGPFLYNMNLVQPNANAIDLVLSVKSANQLGLNTREAGAYSAVLDLLGLNDDVAAAISSISDAPNFQRGFADLLPGSDASVMSVLASNATAAFGATAHRLDMISAKPNAPGGAWTEEFGVYHKVEANADTTEISGGGFGVAAGVDLISTGTALVGTYVSLESAELEEEGRTGAPLNVAQTSFGAYAGWLNGNLALNGTASYGLVNFTSDRKVTLGSLTDRISADWNGSSYSAAARATYTVPLGWFDVKPFVGVDYIGFNQDAYSETAQSESGLALVASDADASLATASYGFKLVGNLGADDAYSIRPEISAGYRNVLSWKNNAATLRFADSPTTSTFSLASGVEPEDAIVAGLGLNIDSEFLNIKVGYDAEISDSSMTHYGSVTFRLAFW
ncbi:MAG: autotransporter domain-containing protein [Hyphomonadaceae bacterium]